MKTQKIVVFDLDETLGYFTELGAFIDALEGWLKKSISRAVFYQILDIFAKFYLRPNILHILRYLKEKKKKGTCSRVMIYTNNNGPRRWTLAIKSYLEHKLNYKLFDRIITAYKIGNKQIEKCRTSHDKSYNDLLACGKISRNAKICFFDDIIHPKMNHENVLYIKLSQYRYTIPFSTQTELFLKSKIGNMIDDKEQFANYMYKTQFRLYYGSTTFSRKPPRTGKGSGSYLPPTEKKQIMSQLHYFLYKF